MNNFPATLVALRTSAKISQAELAKKIGLSVRSISRWESGAKAPTLESIIILADFFKVPTDYLLGRTNY